jgi:trigger factor
LKTEKTYTEDHQVKLTTEIESELVDQFKRRAARQIARGTRIPGFRPGKAPYNMVLSYVGEEHIFQEAIDLLVEDVYPKILNAEEIKPWGPGSLDNIASEDPLVLEFTVPLDPEVELKGLEELNKKYEFTPVTDTEVEEFVMSMRRDSANIVPVETPAEEGNVVYMTVEAVDKDADPETDPVIVRSSPQQTLIPKIEESRKTEWPYEGFAREFIGKKEGETFTLEHKYPEDHESEDFAGKTVLFNVNLQSVKALELPEIDEEFLINAGGFGTVEDLYAGVKEHLQSERKEEYDDAYYLELVDRLRQDSVIKYPPQMLKDEEEEVLQRIEHDLEHRNLDLDLYLKLRKLDREQFNEEEVKPTAKNRIERSLIMDAITKHYEIKISNEELEQEVAAVISNLLMSGEFSEAQKSLGSKKFSESVSMQAANQALENSIRRKLRELADPEEVIEIKTPETTESPAEEIAEDDAEKE